jgi:hypothetical protein
MINETHRILIEALQTQCVDELRVKRYGETCYLVVKLGDQERVFVDRFGWQESYRHAWQVRAWLWERFQIPESDVQVDIGREYAMAPGTP